MDLGSTWMKTSKNNMLWVPVRLSELQESLEGWMDFFLRVLRTVKISQEWVANCGLCGQTAWVQVLVLWLYHPGKVAQHLCALVSSSIKYVCVCSVLSDSL